jgi:hypothetical protein
MKSFIFVQATVASVAADSAQFEMESVQLPQEYTPEMIVIGR